MSLPAVTPVDPSRTGTLQALIDGKAKPPGSRGHLEALAIQLGLIAGHAAPKTDRALLLVFAGDHGLTQAGVSSYPAAVTQAMVATFLAGKASANVFASVVGADMRVVDAGVDGDLAPHPKLMAAKVSMPDASRVREALANCPFVVVSDCVADTDTTAFADVKLPALAWGEKDGTVTNSERRISRQRALFSAPGSARPDWRIVADVAQAMGFEGFGWTSQASVFREWARLTAYENQGRLLNLSGLSNLGPDAYAALEPVQWPVLAGGEGTSRLFADGCFQTADHRARLVPTRPRGPADAVDPVYPLSLNTGRVRDQWHTMTLTGLAPDLCRHAPEPFVEIHPADAAVAGLVTGALTRIITARGEAVAAATVTDRLRPGGIFMPMHWTDAFAPSGRSKPLIAPNIDPVSGQPEFKHTPARIRPYRETWKGFFLSRDTLAAPTDLALVWQRIPHDSCQQYEFAGRGDVLERETVSKLLSRALVGEVLAYEDAASGTRREAWVRDGHLVAMLCMTTTGRLPPRDWLADLFALPVLTPDARSGLLFGRPQGVMLDHGPLVCACLKISSNAITGAIAAGAQTTDAVGTATGAGTNCGSCRSEIAGMIVSAMRATPVKETVDVT